jgi:hypothetical protein
MRRPRPTRVLSRQEKNNYYYYYYYSYYYYYVYVNSCYFQIFVSIKLSYIILKISTVTTCVIANF